jgi:hypothetical protein
MKIAACSLLMAVGFCSAVLADEPQSPAPQTPAVQPPAAQASAPGAASGVGDAGQVPSTPVSAVDAKAAGAPVAPAPKADKSTVVDASSPTEAEIKQMRGRGYKPLARNGTVVFCRDEGEMGSHFVRTRCNTLKELKDAELRGKDYVNSLQRSADPFKGP